MTMRKMHTFVQLQDFCEMENEKVGKCSKQQLQASTTIQLLAKTLGPHSSKGYTFSPLPHKV